MRVRSLELCGFKSFPKKTTIHFEPGVTAIVGPNGSGKTNLVDGIRWVLGEHNPRDIRAPRLEDVIFNGTDRTAPVSMAEVTLTIDNQQGLLPIAFSDVAITRRVYRSGESECFINQSPCRLKDIQELFMGTGLGGGTYAIIAQGHIDLILSSKPEERRVVFEEASGVAKYLAKKAETVRRLDETEEHLVRIADIVGEVRRQIGALERAANKARQYKAQWEQLKRLELRLAVDEMREGRARFQQLEAELAALDAKRQELDGQKQIHVASLEGLNAAISAVQQRLQELRTQVVERASQIEQHEGQRALKDRWIEELAAQAQGAEQEAVRLRGRIAQLDEQLARTRGGETELQAQRAAAHQRLDEAAQELAAVGATLDAASHAVATAKAQLFEAASEASRQRNGLSEVTSRLQGLDAHLARIEEQKQQRAAQTEAIRRRHDEALREREALQAQYGEIERRVGATGEQVQAAAARRHELAGQLHQLRDQLANERARVALLEDLWRRYEGFPDTAKALLSRPIEGLIGPLADLVHAASGYEALVESALGPLSEAIVVQDREALARCRELLAAEQLEGCRFLVLSDCPSQPAPMADGVADPVGAGTVRQYVRADPKYQPLVDWILNDSWVVEDLERLLRERAVPQGRLVSRRGERWDRRSWRFGSPRAAAHARVGRKQRWEEARDALQRREQAFTRLEAQAQAAEQEWQSLVQQQESDKGQLAHMAPSLLKMEAHTSQLASEIEQMEQEQRTREMEAQELIRQREELRASAGRAQHLAEEAQERQQALERSLAEMQAAREAAAQRQQQLLITKAQVEASWQSLSDRLDALQARRQELEGDRGHLAQQVEAKARQQQEALRRAQELSQQLEGHRQAAETLREERARLEAEADEVARALREEEAKRNQVLPHLLEVEQQLSGLVRQVEERSQQLAERTFRRSRLIERLRELYQVDDATLEAQQQAEATPLTEEQRAAMSADIQRLRAKLEGIGPVSLGSVEEYDELKRRLEFLQSQQQDLLQARDDLKASITQINRTARTQFRETFERIRQEFQTYFSRLFNGGEANLVLLDEGDVLESGIDIIARPPGKRLQSISLLSGGERALTAVALLFALFKIRPSPLCILDEIDAPLDEANVDRFTRVLEEFLSLSQFILVTHNKKTITKADSLYGVTMEEPGISKILSAKLTAADSATPAAPTPVAA
jgi:chromosome segregation protein